MSISDDCAGVTPASLSFLAIYNPSLSKSEETFHDQIVYYYSRASNVRSNGKHGGENGKEDRNERERQIGLARGMVEFAKGFSNDKAVDSIETEKSRIILHELETDWWLLASVELTRLPRPSEIPAQPPSKVEIPPEYSAREVCPPALLLEQILRAHRIFLLHQAPSIAKLHARMPRPKFCGFLKRFWDAFIWSWDVLLHGNPAVDVFNGIKLAAGGELGIGVGEEDWGSGEREVLEGFIGKTEGLVDLVVSRFGNTARTCQAPATKSIATPSSRDVNLGWQIPGVYPRPSDGVIFSGIGALTRASVRDVSSWMEWLYMHGKDGYGVRDNPSSAPRRKRRRTQQDSLEHNDQAANVEKHGDNTRSVSSKGRHSYEVSNNTSSISTSIPPPLVRVRQTQDTGTTVNGRNKPFVSEQNSLNEQSQDPAYSTDNLMKYLTLGVYGSRWGITSGRPSIHARDSSLHRDERDKDSKAASSAKVRMNSDPEASGGYFLIGLQGQLDEDVQEGEVGEREESTDRENIPTEDTVLSNRIVMRTLHLERVSESFTQSDKETASSGELPTDRFYDRLRVVVYVQKPFMFTFLFDLQTDALAMPSFYRSLHHHLGPLQRPLLASTSPKRVAERLWDAASPKSTASTTSSLPISDLIYDPVRLTVHTTIPNIPEPRPSTANQYEEEPLPWTRVEALSVHSQILNTYSSTRRHTSEQERTSKTGRQWWVVWMRLPHTPLRQSSSSKTFREAFLIRKASDYVSAELRKTSSRFGRDISGSNTSAGWGSGKLAEGIGIDARKYIEGILSLNR